MINKADLVIVMGTSLKVYPFSTLIDTRSLPESTPLVVINSVNPGIERNRLLVLSGDIEASTRALMEDAGWGEVSGSSASVKSIDVDRSVAIASMKERSGSMKESFGSALVGDRSMQHDAVADTGASSIGKIMGCSSSVSSSSRLQRKRKLCDSS